MLVLLILCKCCCVCLIYGPIAAYLIEAFPAKIRYTSLSLPYHIGNGVFGGLLPLIGLSIVAETGNIYAGLYYPMIVAGLTFICRKLVAEGDTWAAHMGRDGNWADGGSGLTLVGPSGDRVI